MEGCCCKWASSFLMALAILSSKEGEGERPQRVDAASFALMPDKLPLLTRCMGTEGWQVATQMFTKTNNVHPAYVNVNPLTACDVMMLVKVLILQPSS